MIDRALRWFFTRSLVAAACERDVRELPRLFLLWLTARLPAEQIAHQGVTFLERYYVTTLLGWRVYIHRFIDSDPDGLHDHPWRYGVSIILRGWYLEERRERTYVRKWFNVVNGDTFHRVIVPHGAEAWTLFVHNRRCKSWGFLRPFSRVLYDHESAGVYGGVPMKRVEGYLWQPLTPAPGHGTWHLTAPKGRDIRRAA